MKKVWNWFVEKKPIALYKWKSAFLNRSDKNIKRENIKPMIGGSDDQLALSRYRTNNGTSDSLDIMFQQSSSAIFPPLNDDFEEFFDESANAIEVALVCSNSLFYKNFFWIICLAFITSDCDFPWKNEMSFARESCAYIASFKLFNFSSFITLFIYYLFFLFILFIFYFL